MAKTNHDNLERGQDPFEGAAVEIDAEQVSTREFVPDAQSPYAAPTHQTSPVSAPPVETKYSYPRKMVIAAFVLGIVGTSLAVIALLLSLISLASGAGVRGGHRAGISISESVDGRNDRVAERFTEDFDVRDRSGRTGMGRDMTEETFGNTHGHRDMRERVFEFEVESDEQSS